MFERSLGTALKSLALVALLGTASASWAAESESQKQAPSPAAGTAADMGKGESSSESIDDRIQALHDRLKITSRQEDEWKDVADVMRKNSETMHALYQKRAENAANMTAIDDLRSYQDIIEAHEEGNKKLTSEFEDLYNKMSKKQKKNADDYFRYFGEHSHTQQ